MPKALRAVLCSLVFLAASAVHAAEWQSGVFYALGSQVTYQGPAYDCITAHTSQAGWEPNVATSLWALASGTPVPTPTPTATAAPLPGGVEITPGASGVSASTSDSNVPANTVDNNLGTRWSGNGDGAWIRYDLGFTRPLTHVRVAVHQGNARRNRFDLQTSTDGATWTTVFAGQSSGTTSAEEVYDFPDRTARYVRYLGHMATLNAGGTTTWNSVSEVSIYGACPVPTPIPTPRPINLTATAGDAQVGLAWQSGSTSTGAHTYEVLRGITSGGPYAVVATVNTSGTRDASRVDGGLENGTTYFYVVREVYSWTDSCSGQGFTLRSQNSDERSATPAASTGPTPSPTPTPTRPPYAEWSATATASTHDGNVPANTLDGSLATRWSASGDGQWIRFDLGSTQTLGYVTIGTYSGNTRRARFDLQVSDTGAAWTNVLTNVESSGTTTQEETFDFADVAARYVRYLGHGNSDPTKGTWNSVTEVSLFVAASGPPPATPTPTGTPTLPPVPTPTATPTGAPGGGFPPA